MQIDKSAFIQRSLIITIVENYSSATMLRPTGGDRQTSASKIDKFICISSNYQYK
ncbi:MAG TPA: hypothetical protein V6D25_25780 [Leptolyngbyaceae cyanobacterium]